MWYLNNEEWCIGTKELCESEVCIEFVELRDVYDFNVGILIF